MLAYITSLLRFTQLNWAPQQCACRRNVANIATRSTLHHNKEWLATLVPAFAIQGDQIEVLSTPTDFYNTLKEESKRAKRRIVLSSLYLGTGHLEHELVESIRDSLTAQPDLEVQVLLDYTRGSRGTTSSSRTMLLPLLSDFTDKVKVALYHTPNLRGWRKRLLPERYNELIGLQHMKIYLFDDNVLMSGANLSDSYFTNRQDRYVIFRNSSQLANFFSQLVSTVSSFSFQLDKDNHVEFPKSNGFHPFKDSDNGKAFQTNAKRRVEALMKEYHQPTPKPDRPSDPNCPFDTWVFPLVQMGQLGIDLDHLATTRLLHELPERSKVRLASGYFNLTDDYVHDVVFHSQSELDVLTASPEANGFFGGQGISGAIPDAYTCILKTFYRTLCEASQTERVHIHEWYRSGWTFHAKGMWCYLPDSQRPSITLVGSPNFGYRSRYRDLEAQVAVLTQNEGLQQQLENEQQRLYEPSEPVTMETFEQPARRVPHWVSLVTRLIKHFC